MIAEPIHQEAVSLHGSFPAMIFSVQGVDSGTPYALVENISYTVLVDAPTAQLIFAGQIPRNRRPGPPGTEVVYARPGDECTVNIRWGRVRCNIIEGLNVGDC